MQRLSEAQHFCSVRSRMNGFYLAFFIGSFAICLSAIGIYLPGPPGLMALALRARDLFLVGTILGLILALPVAIIWSLVALRLKRQRRARVNKFFYLAFALFGVAFVNLIFLTKVFLNLAAERAIARATPAIEAVESFRSEFGGYPPTLGAAFEREPRQLPTPGSLGSPSYRYEINEDAYDLSFVQCNNIACTNPRIYIYNPRDNQRGFGGAPAFSETDHPHWRYFILD